jgi:hypothetical protein
MLTETFRIYSNKLVALANDSETSEKFYFLQIGVPHLIISYLYMRIKKSSKNKLLKAHYEIKKETETEIMLPPRGKLSTGGQLLEETIL